MAPRRSYVSRKVAIPFKRSNIVESNVKRTKLLHKAWNKLNDKVLAGEPLNREEFSRHSRTAYRYENVED